MYIDICQILETMEGARLINKQKIASLPPRKRGKRGGREGGKDKKIKNKIKNKNKKVSSIVPSYPH